MNKLNEENFSSELSEVLEKIRENITKSSSFNLITPEFFMKEVLKNNKCSAYKIIDKIMFSNTINRLINGIRKPMRMVIAMKIRIKIMN